MAEFKSTIDTYSDLKNKRSEYQKGSDDYKSLSKDMTSTAIGGGLSAISGLTGILDTSLQLAQPLDSTAYQNQLSDMAADRNKTYYDYDSLSNDMVNRSRFTMEDGALQHSTGEIAAGSAKSALTGATTGLQIAGPWGALVGGVIGAGSGIIGGLVGRSNAKTQENILRSEAATQDKLNSMAFSAQADNVRDYQYGQLYGTRMARGGKIEIKPQNKGSFTQAAKQHHMTVQEFAKEVLAKTNARKYSALMRKRANFARNAAGWSHAEGGAIDIGDRKRQRVFDSVTQQILKMPKSITQGQPYFGPTDQLGEGYERYIGNDGTLRVPAGTNPTTGAPNDAPLKPMESEIAEWLPGTGDVIDVGYAVGDAAKGNYGAAALGFSLAFLPEPLQRFIKQRRNAQIFKKLYARGLDEQLVRDDLAFYLHGHNAKSRTGEPLFIAKRHPEVIGQDNAEKIVNFASNPTANKWGAYTNTQGRYSMTAYGRQLYDDKLMNDVPQIVYTNKIPKDAYAAYSPDMDIIGFQTKPGKILINKAKEDGAKDALWFAHGILAHENIHRQFGPQAHKHTKDRALSVEGKGYNVLNPNLPNIGMDAKDYEILAKAFPADGKWWNSPEEFLAEYALIRTFKRILKPFNQLPEKTQKVIATQLSKRFKIKPDESKQVLDILTKYGYADGGYLQ